MPVQGVLPAVPAFDREAEAGAADFEVGPVAGALGVEDGEHAGTVGDEFPAALGLFADQAVADTGIAVAVTAAFGDDDFGQAVAVEVADFLDGARGVAYGRVVAGLPLLALEREAGGLEGGLVDGRQLGRRTDCAAAKGQQGAGDQDRGFHRRPSFLDRRRQALVERHGNVPG